MKFLQQYFGKWCNEMFNSIITWWHHQMETFSVLRVLCAGNSPVTGEFPHKGQWYGAFMFSLIYAWINAWVNNRHAGDLRRHRAHYDVIVNCNELQYVSHVADPIKVKCVPLTRYATLWFAHALGMPATFSPPPRESDFDMHVGIAN